jgi:hypothetical protein
MLLRASATDRLGIAVRRSHQALLLEPAQRAVGGAERRVPARTLDERPADRHAVGIVTQAGKGQQDEQLELPKVVRHAVYILHNAQEINGRAYPKILGSAPWPSVPHTSYLLCLAVQQLVDSEDAMRRHEADALDRGVIHRLRSEIDRFCRLLHRNAGIVQALRFGIERAKYC